MSQAQSELEKTVAMAALLARGPQALEDFHEVATLVRQALLCEYWGRYKGADTESTETGAQAVWLAEIRDSVELKAAVKFVEERGNELVRAWMEGHVRTWIERSMVDAFAAMTAARRSHGPGAEHGSA